MMLVKTILKYSQVHGLGIFAEEFIPKGTEVWRFTPGLDQKFTREQILALPDLDQQYLYKYTWRSRKSLLYILAADNNRHSNHSSNPNTLSEYRDDEEEVVTVALRDIEIGEELLDDYSSFEDVGGEDNLLVELAEKFKFVDELDPRLKNQEK